MYYFKVATSQLIDSSLEEKEPVVLAAAWSKRIGRIPIVAIQSSKQSITTTCGSTK